MKIAILWILPLLLVVMSVLGTHAGAEERSLKRKVLVVVSSKSSLTMKNGHKHPTGFFLNELGVPVKTLVDAGFEPVFCNPLGNEAAMDKVSDNPFFFERNQKDYETVRSFVDSLPGLKHPFKLSDVASGELDQYKGIFVPGGHAPMEDLWNQPALGKILRYFHEKHKPTALICHGPVALLSALDRPGKLIDSLDKKNTTPSKKHSNWPYTGYQMTVFSTAEEKPNEQGGPSSALGGCVPFYPESALKAAGGDVSVVAPGKSHIVVDRELFTGQNPASDKELSEAFIKALSLVP